MEKVQGGSVLTPAQQHFRLLVNALEIAQEKGIYNLSEARNIANAVDVVEGALIPPPAPTSNVQPPKADKPLKPKRVKKAKVVTPTPTPTEP